MDTLVTSAAWAANSPVRVAYLTIWWNAGASDAGGWASDIYFFISFKYLYN